MRSLYYVPSFQAGRIIGRGGSTIRQLKADTGCDINIDDGVLELTGEEAEIEAALDAIRELVSVVSAQPLVTAKLAVPGRKVGAIIGQRGATLRQIEEEAGVSLDAPNRGTPPGTPFVLVGSAEGILKARLMMLDAAEIDDGDMVVVDDGGIAELGGTPHDEGFDSDEDPEMDLNADVSEALFFTGDGDVDALGRLLDALRSVRTTLDVCVFTITDDRIVRVLKRLHRKGVAVRVITDNDTSVATGSDIGDLREDGIEVRTDDNEFHMHHKFAVLDNTVLVNGSYNWTRGASQKNHENIVLTGNPDLVAQFASHFNSLWDQFE